MSRLHGECHRHFVIFLFFFFILRRRYFNVSASFTVQIFNVLGIFAVTCHWETRYDTMRRILDCSRFLFFFFFFSKINFISNCNFILQLFCNLMVGQTYFRKRKCMICLASISKWTRAPCKLVRNYSNVTNVTN